MKSAVLSKGKRFGNLIVLDESVRKTHGGKRRKSCYCLCDCGIKKWIRQRSLLCGDTKSCGCLLSKLASDRAKKRIGPKIDRSGQKYGLLTVVAEWRREKSGQGYVIKWKCRCDCGVEKWVQSSILSRTKSCGCLHRQNVAKHQKIKPGLAAFNQVFSSYRIRAKRKGLSFSLSPNDFAKITKRNCYYCGSFPSNTCVAAGRNGEFVYNGIDRKNNKFGYTLKNVVACCKICNQAKGELTIAEFVKWLKNISSFIDRSHS